jgi:hypothetical protein
LVAGRVGRGGDRGPLTGPEWRTSDSDEGRDAVAADESVPAAGAGVRKTAWTKTGATVTCTLYVFVYQGSALLTRCASAEVHCAHRTRCRGARPWTRARRGQLCGKCGPPQMTRTWRVLALTRPLTSPRGTPLSRTRSGGRACPPAAAPGPLAARKPRCTRSAFRPRARSPPDTFPHFA